MIRALTMVIAFATPLACKVRNTDSASSESLPQVSGLRITQAQTDDQEAIKSQWITSTDSYFDADLNCKKEEISENSTPTIWLQCDNDRIVVTISWEDNSGMITFPQDNINASDDGSNELSCSGELSKSMTNVTCIITDESRI